MSDLHSSVMRKALEEIEEIAGRPISGTSLQMKANRFDLIKSKARVALALTRPQSRTDKVCAYHDGCPPDGPVCHLCEHLQPK